MHRSSRSERILGPEKTSVVLRHITLDGFCGVTCTLLCEGWRQDHALPDDCSAAQSAFRLVQDAMSGVSVDIPAGGQSSIVRADFEVRPSAEELLIYDVRYELRLETDEGGRCRLSGECISYVECRGDEQQRRRKAFDTIRAGKYEGVRPLDIAELLARSREDRAALSALRILCTSSRRSFLFSSEFSPYAARTVHLRPGAFFLRVLRAFALGGMRQRFKPEDGS